MVDARIIFIAGPTASGKSAAALGVAKARGGEIVNADAMQVYSDLRIVTARPSEEDEALVPHHLYGVFDGGEACSAGRWALLAADYIKDILGRGKTAIVTGGTGLYFKSLEEGLSPIPDIPPDVRLAAEARREKIGPSAFRDEVIARDPVMARLPEGDAQRLLRAWEVIEATGDTLSSFQNLPRAPLIDGPIEKAIILPERKALYERCDVRAAAMFVAGAIEEVRMLCERGLDPSLPVMKALGVQEITGFIRGDLTSGEALAKLQQNTRRFAKRQTTWFRHQTRGWPLYETAHEALTVL
ncbi:MAG: tRNA (adenosine(37)-N6)-dimethylallyltransferase MiaA [Alphaproteobacteria bacterium]|nr:tRNA (adenosine(37)-N6)-dimethylallyltransferase MiaA [Alphaproteobacteria bacterium]